MDTQDFATDFNLSLQELQAYFDDDPANPHNQHLQQAHPAASSYTRLSAFQGAIPHQPLPAPAVAPQTATPALPAPLLLGTPVAPPAVNHWWDAEDYVANALRGAGWTVHNVSRQRLGYDFHAQQGRQVRYIDVKSSLGYCTVSMTAREWQQAQFHRASYVLAIIENFDRAGQNVIFWVPDPCNAGNHRATATITYSVPRTTWAGHTVPLTNI